MASFVLSPAQVPMFESLCRSTVGAALQLPGILDAGIALYDGTQDTLRLEYMERREGQPSPFAELTLDEGSVTVQALQTGRTVWVREFAEHAPQSPVIWVGGVDSVIAAPLTVADQTIGAVVVTAAAREVLTAVHLGAIEALAAGLGFQLAHWILQARYAHLQKLYAALRASNRLLIGPVRTRDELYDEACRICVRHAGFALAWIARPDEAGWFRTLAVAGSVQDLSERIQVSSDAWRPEGQGSMGQAWRTGQAAYRQTPRAEHHYRPWHAALEDLGLHGFAAVPLKRNGRVDAVLAVGAYEADYFGDEERLLFEEIGIDLSEALSLLDERIRTQLAATAVQHAPTGIMVAEPDTQRVRYSNTAMTTLTGQSQHALRDRAGLFFMPGDPMGRSLPGFAARIGAGRRWQGPVWGRRAEHIWEASVEVRTITGPDRTPRLLALFGPPPDAAGASLRDPLTGLPNADGFHQALERRVSETPERGLVVIRINVRDLTSINSGYGRAGGDQILVDLAGRLRHALPMSTLVARLEGDNFALLTRALRRDAVARVAQRLLRQVDASIIRPFEIDGHALPVRLTTGVAFHPGDAPTAGGLLAEAEMVLGQTRYQDRRAPIESTGQPDAIRARLATAARLQHAFHEGHGIHPWYQPKICLHDGTLTGAEALVRWQDDARGLVSPGEFLPLTEALGLTGQLDRTMLDAVLRDLARWQTAAGGLVPIAINLSAGQLTDEDLTRRLLEALQAHGLPASLLHVEITEHDVITDVAAARTVLQQLDAAGIEVSLDDFGTGYSSLSILRDLPLTRLKLDKSFIDRLPDDARSLKVAQMAIELAHALEMEVIAEGIESQEQADVLRDLDCDYAQGFFFARPMPASEFEDQWLRG
ncbi:bifunctional diguanylate cyclase/phosphodiesterase [Salinisphaera sp. RV14]|uniref:bifunctional diguanylate cyclase/phosphodiesterase n=1 Tax=unclassified Salinisphaera TaxID=2649847 RepID=UPI003F853AF7